MNINDNIHKQIRKYNKTTNFKKHNNMKTTNAKLLMRIYDDIEIYQMQLNNKINEMIRGQRKIEGMSEGRRRDLKTFCLVSLELIDLMSVLEKSIKMDGVEYKEKIRRAEQMITYEIHKRNKKGLSQYISSIQ